jgi:hypothetical protein
VFGEHRHRYRFTAFTSVETSRTLLKEYGDDSVLRSDPATSKIDAERLLYISIGETRAFSGRYRSCGRKEARTRLGGGQGVAERS